MPQIKLIWDFRGPQAAKTAEHHEKHLREYTLVKNLELRVSGCRHITHTHSATFMIIDRYHLPEVKADLRPHRGEFYDL